MDIPGLRTSSVIVHRVPVNSVEHFLEWQHGITRVVENFPGYQTTDLYPPTEPGQLEWVVVINFDSPESLQHWLNSPVRSEWVAKLQGESANFLLKTLSTGFGPWFAELVKGSDPRLPPAWKIALTVLLGLYPTVMLITLFVAPHLKSLGLALSMLIGNALSICILQWGVMPVLNAKLAPWLQAHGKRGKARSLSGLGLILLALGGMMLLFRWVTT
ncbi:hypothetical protein DO97_14770 [Neosynechococcus sphagnicola sy1]|uniref:Antibiotic biosynthesis monooxygenase n=1 Tax=Neosynechococcus sphagnicola sy1 TaxID=1497020 RepID=A0A098TIF1_9CYAN|nr:hypothetical protein [Neosynechococcus sphagnicola]KGF71889.1 hypothetical protein DO97_14770 [Neosynechococcus sphagnicola sy1]